MGRKRLYMCIALLMFTLSGMLPVYAEQTEFETEAGTESETEQSDFEIEGTILTAYHGTSAEVIVPSGVTEIGPWCFSGNRTMLKAVLPETVQVIDERAFYRTALEEIVLPASLREIGNFAFYSSALREVSLPEGLEVIGSEAFYCEELSRVCIPRSVREIGYYAFASDTYIECYGGTAGFAYAKGRYSNNYTVLDAKNISSLQITLSQTEFVCNGYEVRPEVNVLDGGTALKERTDYTVKYEESIYPGIYTLTVQALLSENYTGSSTLTYTIRPRTVRHLVSGLKTSSGKAALQWNESLGADSYEVRRYESKWKKWFLVKKTSKTTYTDVSLQADTNYKYRVRACADVDGQTIYGDDSSILTVRTLPKKASIKKTNNSVKKGAVASINSVKTDLGVKLDTSSLGSENYSHVSDVTEFLDGKGNYCIAYIKGNHVYIRKYASSSKLKLKQTLKIKRKYPLFGGVACDKDNNYYIVWGKNDDKNKGKGNVDTMAISKYDSKGKHVKTTKYYTEKDALKKGSWDTRCPFSFGNCAIAIKGNFLICSYGRQMYYGHPENFGHQSNDVLSVNTATMEKVTRFSNYVSHSFNQSLLISKDDEAVFVNHGDAYPRGIETAKEYLSDPPVQEQSVAKKESPATKNVSFHFYGDQGDNWTGAQLGGIAEVSSGFFLAAAGPKSMTKKAYNESRNVFVQLLSKTDLESVLKGSSRSGTSCEISAADKGILWLTNYSSQYTASAVSITATDDDRVIVMWEKLKDNVSGNSSENDFEESYYIILSANGKILQKATGLGGRRLNIYEAPVYRKGYLYWTSADDGMQKATTYRLKINGVVMPKSLGKVEGLTFEKTDNWWKQSADVWIKWKKVNDAKGYEIYRSTDKNGNYKKVKDVNDAGIVKWNDKDVPQNATYYYKIRAFRNVNGKRVVGQYSQTLKVTVKIDRPQYSWVYLSTRKVF